MRDRVDFWICTTPVWHPVLIGAGETACGIGLDSLHAEPTRERLGVADEECSVCRSEIATTIIAGVLPAAARWSPYCG